jgi:hypothetical protein
MAVHTLFTALPPDEEFRNRGAMTTLERTQWASELPNSDQDTGGTALEQE